MSHEKGIEAAQDKIYDVVSVDYGGLSRDPDAALQIIKAYLDASGMVMVPKDPTPEMVVAARLSHEGEAYLPYSLYSEMIAAAPNPFECK